MASPASDTAGPAGTYWRHTLRITAALLLLWLVATFGGAYFARDLDFDFFGWPFSFWMASQGALLLYLAIVGAYALWMRRLDRQHGVDEDE